MPKVSNVNKVCRICSTQNSGLVDIHQKNDKAISYYNKLNKIVPEMKNVKKSSRKMCQICISELNAAYNFYQKCLNSLQPAEFKVILLDKKLNKPNSKCTQDENANDSIESDNTDVEFTLQLPESPILPTETTNVETSPQISLKRSFDSMNNSTQTNNENINPEKTKSLETINNNISSNINLETNNESTQELKMCVMCNQQFNGTEKLETHFKNVHAIRKLLEYDSYGTITRATGKDTHKFIAEVNYRVNKRTSLLETSQEILSNIKDKHIEKDNNKNSEDKDTDLCHITDTTSEISNETDQMSVKEHENIGQYEMKKKKKYECLYCGKILDKKVQLTKHLQLHEISVLGKKYFKCKYCDLTFGELTRLALHVRVHENQDIFECHICLTVCSSAGSLRAHMHVHDEKRKSAPGYLPHKKGGFTCRKCGVRLASRGSINSHMATHSSAKPYQCPNCPSAFKTKACLIQHLHCMHAPINYPCTVCDRNFNYKYALLQHLATHAEEQKC